jgi:hypothetical protein
MSFGYAVFALLVVLAAGATFFLRRASADSSDDRDLGSVSTSWLAEHRSGHQ